MLKTLFGSRSVGQVLLFLLVNEEAYAQQIHQSLQVPLAPVQKALQRLLQGGLLCTSQEGKRRLYRLDPNSPLYSSLQRVLQDLFKELPADQKRAYLRPIGGSGVHRGLVQKVWEGLQRVSRVKVVARSQSSPSLNGTGEAVVEVCAGNGQLVFEERGRWDHSQTYRNALRWSYQRFEDTLALEHLRFGANNPVYLFHLVPDKQNLLKSAAPHVCGEDTYFGWLQVHELYLHLHIRTLGPSKNEKIESIYT